MFADSDSRISRWIRYARRNRRRYIWWSIKAAYTIRARWVISCFQVICWFGTIVQRKEFSNWNTRLLCLMFGRIDQWSTTTRTPSVLRTIYWLQLIYCMNICEQWNVNYFDLATYFRFISQWSNQKIIFLTKFWNICRYIRISFFRNSNFFSPQNHQIRIDFFCMVW